MSAQPGGVRTPLTGRTVGHYRLERMVGAGGMGEVYRARDERLDRTVAVKVLPDHLAKEVTARGRFVRETRLACKVIHPYVATVFDVVEDGPDLFLVMEYIEGHRLSTLMRTATPKLPEMLDWSVEIAEGLHAIHRAGMVHRDLKPGNVMITPDRHVKVMDFGLARPLPVIEPNGEGRADSREATITREGAGVGTVLYMSPEQVRGERVDQRSDLFALGSMLYEAISGVHPFSRSTLLESASAILHESPGGGTEPDSLTEAGPVRNVILKLLEKNPDQRYQSADELVEELREVSRSSGPDLSIVPRGMLRGAFVAVGLLAVIAATAGYWLSRPVEWERPRYSIAVAPFFDRTGQPDGALRAAMLTDLLAADLESSRLVRAVGPGRTTSLLRDLPPDAGTGEIARQVARGADVDYVLIGTLYWEDDRYHSTLEWVLSDGSAPDLPAVRASDPRIIRVAENLAGSLRRSLPEVPAVTAWKDDRIDLVELTSSSEEARLLYQRGVTAWRDGQSVEAAEMFEDATEIDPAFSLAWVALAGALDGMGYGRRAREAASTALSLAPEPDSRARERLALTIRGTWARIFHRTGEAVEITGKLAARFPDEPDVLRQYAAALYDAGNYDGALEQIDRALAVDPPDVSLHLSRARTLLGPERNEEALAAIDDAERLARLVESREGLAEVLRRRGDALLQMQRYAEAQSAWELSAAEFSAAGREIDAARALLGVAEIDMLTGRPAAAEQRTLDAERLARENGSVLLTFDVTVAKANQAYMRGDLEAAEALYREATDQARRLENDLNLLYPLTTLGNLLAYTFRREEAREVLVETVEIATRLHRDEALVSASLSLAGVEFESGRIDAAIAAYEQVLGEIGWAEQERLGNWALLGLAEIDERRGQLEPALDKLEAALANGERLALQSDAGYALVQRSRILAALRLDDRSAADLDRVSEIVGDEAAGLEDLRARVAVARGHRLAYAGQWVPALDEARNALDLPGGAVPQISASARLLICQAGAMAGRYASAIDSCRRLLDDETLPVPDQADARSMLAIALAGAGRPGQAREQAERALEEAGRLGLRLAEAHAAATLLSASAEYAPDQPEVIRQRGMRALAEYVAEAPAERRDAIRKRGDMSALLKKLEG